MAVRLDVTPTGVHVQLTGIHLVAACSRGLHVPFERIVGTRVMARNDAVASSPHLPCPGFSWPGRSRIGAWGVGERRQLWGVRDGRHVVVIYLSGRPFHRVVIDVEEPQRAHRHIEAALLHTKKTGPRRSLRDLPPQDRGGSTTSWGAAGNAMDHHDDLTGRVGPGAVVAGPAVGDVVGRDGLPEADAFTWTVAVGCRGRRPPAPGVDSSWRCGPARSSTA